ncbi:DUF4870 domain-containing protein [Flavobacterium sp.]|uniref:DUF4870 domain-containing protein n=1 Tax=Flavobacterium sp. TaxID=239 RepID=UPI0028BEC95C|nr:DUF4870 domain-containing protein [Flavobacterium sp.]
MTTTSDKSTATLLQLSSLTQYFIPLGNYFFPILIWAFRKDKSQFVDYNGKQVLNFQLSLLLYSVILIAIAVPTLLYSFFSNVTFQQLENGNFDIDQLAVVNLSGIAIVAITAVVIFFTLKIVEFFLIIYAAVKASNGEQYKYPLSISFIK